MVQSSTRYNDLQNVTPNKQKTKKVFPFDFATFS